MKYIKFFGSAGFCGTDEEVYDLFLDGITDEELDDTAEEKRRELGESYEYLATQGYDEEDYDIEDDFEEALDQAIEWYWENVSVGWEEVTEEEYRDNV
jgi:hypothetical protein